MVGRQSPIVARSVDLILAELSYSYSYFDPLPSRSARTRGGRESLGRLEARLGIPRGLTNPFPSAPPHRGPRGGSLAVGHSGC